MIFRNITICDVFPQNEFNAYFLILSCTSISLVNVYLFEFFFLFGRAFPQDYDKSLYRAHTEVLYKGLLIHLDDSSLIIQVKHLAT